MKIARWPLSGHMKKRQGSQRILEESLGKGHGLSGLDLETDSWNDGRSDKLEKYDCDLMCHLV